MYDFELIKPSTVEDAVAALAAEDAQLLGGGQTLIPTMKQRLAAPEILVSTTGIANIIGVANDPDGTVRVGGATTHAQVAAEARIPALARLADGIGDPAVRNRGTIGGSIANNDPAACYPAAALGLGATIITNAREIHADDFFIGLFETALDEGEIITAVQFPAPPLADYQKFKQPASRFALTGVFVAKFEDGVRVAVTGASNEGVFRWREAESALSAEFSAKAIAALDVATDDLISDIHGSAAYRAQLVKVLTARAVETAANQQK